MAVVGTFTDIGIEKAREVQNGEGFKIFPESFAVSSEETAGYPTIASMVGLLGANASEFFNGPIASRVIVNTNQQQTLTFSSVPDAGTFTLSFENEVTTALAFNATALDLENALEVLPNIDAAIVSGDFISGFEVEFEGVTLGIDSNFLTETVNQVAISVVTSQQKNNAVKIVCEIPPGVLAGIPEQTEEIREVYLFAKDINDDDFLLACGRPSVTNLYDNQGQTTLRLTLRLRNSDISSNVIFQFTQATEISSHNQDPNSHADIRAVQEKAGLFEQAGQHEFIGQNFDEFAIGPDRSFEIGVLTGDLVYLDIDEVYKKAVADGSIRQRVSGMADIERGAVYTGGILKIQTGYDESTLLYLHPTNAGQVTNVPSGKPIGQTLDDFNIIFRPDSDSQVSEYIDTVVSSVAGFNHYLTIQEAIDAAPVGGWVRVDELEELRGPNPIVFGKQVNLLFTGIASGVQKFGGLNEIQQIAFSSVPDSGDIVLVHEGNKTSRILSTATAGDIETALELLPSITDVTVTGSFTLGFTIEFVNADGLQDQTQIAAGTSLGVNEIQRLNFDSDDFASGSFRLNFDSQLTNFIAFNSITASNIKSELELLSNIASVNVVENVSPPVGEKEFTIEFANADGLQPQILIVDDSNTLQDSGTAAIGITITQDQLGELADNLLLDGITPVTSVGNTTQEGEDIGSDKAFIVDADGVQFIGLGTISGFDTGIDLATADVTRIEMYFDGTNVTPIDDTLVVASDFNTEGSIGYNPSQAALEDTSFRDLVKVEAVSPTPDKTVTISSSEIALSDGSMHGFIVDQRVSIYAGGTINFDTGVVTGGGENFIPYVATMPSYYYKYAIVLKSNDEIEVIQPVGDSANANTAPIPPIQGGILRSVVTVQDDGGGGILTINPEDIKRFFDVGAFPDEMKLREFTSAGGSATFDVSSGGSGDNFTFDPDNETLDIEIFINGDRQTQDRAGGLDFDYRKNSGTEIEFADGEGNPYVVPADARITVKYKDNEIDKYTTGAVQVSFPIQKDTGDGVTSTYNVTPGIGNISTDDTVNDIMVFVNGKKQEMGEDYTKISGTQIKFIDGFGGADFPIENLGRIEIVGRDYALNSGSTGNSIAVKDEGSVISSPIGSIDVVGDFVTADEPTAGDARITVTAEENLATNLPTPNSVGVYHQKTGHVLEFKPLCGISPVYVVDQGDCIGIGIADAPYYVEWDDTQVGLGITLPNARFYSQGSNRLSLYRNGKKSVQSIVAGSFVDRYIERSVTTLELLEGAIITTDVLGYVNEDVQPTRSTVIPVIGSTVLTIPTYVQGNDRLRVWRRGILMTTTGFGAAVDRYSETSTTSITLAEAAVAGDFFIIEYMGEDPDFREDISNFAGNTITLSNLNTVGDDKLLVFRNGLLMINADKQPAMGAPIDRYSEISATQIQFEVNVDLNDWIAFIRKP